VILSARLRSLSFLCHPDEASDASGWKDLGQLRASEAGSGFGSLRPICAILSAAKASTSWRAILILSDWSVIPSLPKKLGRRAPFSYLSGGDYSLTALE
jgi:hypothetical protein